MAITSKSLHHSNVVCIFNEGRFISPDNTSLASIYSGEEVRGMRFIEDPILQTKMLTLPYAKIKITLEGTRLRIDDDSDNEPQKSRVIKDILNVKEKLFPNTPITGYGFNYDVFYRFNNVIPIRSIFDNFFSGEILEGKELRDFGFQFTLESGKGNIIDTFFMKAVSPLELAVHLNRHFKGQLLPTEKELVALFGDCYNNYIDKVVESFEKDLHFN